MGKIKTLLIVNHSHTDIGFTDYQDLCYRQHMEFIDQAMDLFDATANYPDEAKYQWTCEVTGMTERYLRNASDAQCERFRRWNAAGVLDVAGMQYNLTPLLSPEQMIRSLYPVRRLRDEYGVQIRAAMQSDVNGISWIYADLLPAVGIDFLTMSVNPFRGGVPKPMPSGFWWESPTGGKLLTWNGFHYLFGRSIAKLGDWRFVEESLGREVEKLENDEGYPFDFMYCQSTHPIRVDNGPPDMRMADFVRDWNASGREPRMAFTTPAKFGVMLRERYGDALPTWRGDWLDWWSDGVASSAYETGMNRTTHELLYEAEALGAWALSRGTRLWSVERADRAFEQATLYDEHTWGAFASIERPRDRWTKAQWNRKAAFAYTASSETHDLLARGANHLAHAIATQGPEGMFNLGDLDPHAAYPTPNDEHILVINTLPWERDVIVEEPELRGGAAPAGVLDCFFPRGVSWGGARPELPARNIAGRVPAQGFAFLPADALPSTSDVRTGPQTIENSAYRVRIDPTTGAVAEWIDLASGHDFAGSYDGYGIGQYVYEWVDDPDQRNALFIGDFSAEDFGIRIRNTPFRRETATEVVVDDPVVGQGEASITVHISARGIRSGHCTYRLRTGRAVLEIDWLLDKEHVSDVEAVFVAFPFQLGSPRFRADINGVPLTPEQDQLPGTVRDWYPVHHWVDVSDGQRGVTVAPLDAPLVHMGGITTGRWAETLEPDGPTVMSWALHNHWMVNFKASQGGDIPLRYRLTTHEGPCDDVAAERFGREQATPPIVLRDLAPHDALTGEFLHMEDGPVHLIHVKPADFGDGIILRLQNLDDVAHSARLQFATTTPTSARLTSPDERDGDVIAIDGQGFSVDVAPRSIQSLRVSF
ncbi:MAG TPA: glycoside hydrolase family 38 C-terminal domain-containing protein [Thermomicrobiales bacterium]|nr:glycoside hydrolase family 38 C-terminal domain-containing protein [Thermomicrobiales bacterium]